jgi:WD40 repeat protein
MTCISSSPLHVEVLAWHIFGFANTPLNSWIISKHIYGVLSAKTSPLFKSFLDAFLIRLEKGEQPREGLERGKKIYSSIKEKAYRLTPFFQFSVIASAFLTKDAAILCCRDGVIKIIDVDNKAQKSFPLKKKYDISHLVVFPNQNWAITHHSDPTITLCSSPAFDPFPLSGHSKSITSIASITSTLLASASNDDTLKIWDISHLSCRASIKVSATAERIEPISERFLGYNIYEDPQIKLMDIETQAELFSLSAPKDAPLRCFKKLNSPNLLVSGHDDKVLRIWDLTSQQCVWTLKTTEDCDALLPLPGHFIATKASSDVNLHIFNKINKQKERINTHNYGNQIDYNFNGSILISGDNGSKHIQFK